jgi:hypothetical protein
VVAPLSSLVATVDGGPATSFDLPAAAVRFADRDGA